MKYEMSYLDLLEKLYFDVQNNTTIPTEDYNIALQLIEKLGAVLEEYSA